MDTRERVFQLVERHGWNATAFQTLESGFEYFFHGPDACVAYVDTGSAWVAAGAPIAAAGSLRESALAFVAAAEVAGRRSCFFGVEERVHLGAESDLGALKIGEQPSWDPRTWSATLAQHRSLREQLRRARAKQVRVRKVTAEELTDPTLRKSMNDLVDRWLATRPMETMRFLVRVEPFALITHRSYFLAEREGRLIALAVCAPVPARPGWFLENLVRDPEAPNGTPELLIDAVMRWATESGATWLTLGLAPLAGELDVTLRWIRRQTRFLYNFEGLQAYKAKLRPGSWAPIYLTYPRSQGAIVSLWDTLTAFAGTNLFWFGLRSLQRRPSLALPPLAWLLVPWTLLLALAPTEHWFGSSWIQWAWVGFDIGFAAALFQLLRRPHARLARALAIAISGDAILTSAEALTWNVWRVRGQLEWALLLLACFAPALAAVLLWSASRRFPQQRPA